MHTYTGHLYFVYEILNPVGMTVTKGNGVMKCLMPVSVKSLQDAAGGVLDAFKQQVVGPAILAGAMPVGADRGLKAIITFYSELVGVDEEEVPTPNPVLKN